MNGITRIWVLLIAAAAMPGWCQTPPGALDATAPLNPPTYFGINGVGYFHRPDQADELKQRWELMKELGVKWDRSDFWWSDIEKQPDKWDFSKTDSASKLYRSNGVQMFPILDYGAAWRDSRGPANNEQRAEWARYVTRVVGRYKGYCNYWEVWNEPNILPFWRPQPNATDYAKLLVLTAEKARAANPAVKIVAFTNAGLDLPFIEKVLDLAGTDCFDVASYHYYRVDKPEARMPDEVRELRLVLERHGKKCPIWVTEQGVTTYFAEGVSEQVQAVLWMREILLMIGAGVERVFPFTLTDNVSDPGGDWGTKLGMTTLPPECRKKPAFQAYKTMIAQLQDYELVGPVYLADKVQALLFAERGRKPDDRRRKLAVWSTEDAVDVKFTEDGITTEPKGKGDAAGYHSYTTMLGEKLPVEFWNNQARVPAMPAPVYVPVISCELEENAMTRWEKNAIMASPGQSVSTTLTIAMSDARLDEIRIEPPAGWPVKSGSTLTFSVPLLTKPGWHTIKAKIPSARRTVVKELRIWVRPELLGRFRPFFTTGTKEIMTSITLQNINLKGRCGWQFAAEPPLPGLSLPSGVFNPHAAAVGHHVPDSFFFESDELIPASVFQGVRGTTVIRLDWRDEGAPAGSKLKSQRAFAVAVTPLRDTPPVIDASLREFAGVPRMQLGSRDQLTRGDYTGPVDISASVAAVWTADGIYIGADVTDDFPMMNKYGMAGDVYRGDSIEIYLAPAGYKGNYYYDKPAGDSHFALSPGMGGNNAIVSDFEKQVPGSRIAAKSRPGGYFMEAFIPKSAFGGYTPRCGDLVSWDVQVNDRDDYDDSASVRSFMWNGGDMNWLLAGGWGVAVVK
ncbi:MAG: hypothetical protein NTY46_08905 [Candidatus Sumerlaeota bacterium]|nr:hypothetical protein [Candidatus Sumerlaeota bacterium]